MGIELRMGIEWRMGIELRMGKKWRMGIHVKNAAIPIFINLNIPRYFKH